MIVDDELAQARVMVLVHFRKSPRDLTPREVIDQLTALGLSEDLVRAANISLVASGQLQITPAFELHLVEPVPELVAAS